MSEYTNMLWHEVEGLKIYDVPKTYISGVTDYYRISGVANFRPIFEFNQE